ncbi:MAG: Na/Pi symporter [Synechococcaceae cyanobacterium SM2_3_2]|nr:Na/Pi symporter [Synechococcaceae cyanobacterium SM2_3_2]
MLNPEDSLPDEIIPAGLPPDSSGIPVATSVPKTALTLGLGLAKSGGLALLVYGLLVAVGLIGSGMRQSVGEQAADLFGFATNPFLGLMVGLLSTALIQSSATTTSIVVGLVAGGMPISSGIPMIMGANLGTSLTNTLLSVGYVGDRANFQRAFAAGTVQDMFNLLAVLLFFPIERWWHPLELASHWAAHHWVGVGSLSGLTGLSSLAAPATELIGQATSGWGDPGSGLIQVGLGVGLSLGSILGLSRLLQSVLVGRVSHLFHHALGQGSLSGILMGAVMTVLVQSSSTTTSLMVPLAGSGLLELRAIYPFTLGANIGTCFTALIAAGAVGGSAPLQIALVHLFFNVWAVLIIFGIPALRPLPVLLAEGLATAASRRKVIALIYVVGVFFGLPALCIEISNLL